MQSSFGWSRWFFWGWSDQASLQITIFVQVLPVQQMAPNGPTPTPESVQLRAISTPPRWFAAISYYVANGQITPANSTTPFSASDSGSSIITIQKATDTANGTSTGWTAGGTGACNSGQAVFGPLSFGSDYWTFNGVHRGNGTGDPSLDWRTNYGFSVVNNNGNAAPINGQGAINVDGGNPNNNTPFSNITIKYVQVAGSQDISGTYSDMGIQISGGQSTNNYVGYSYIHGVGLGDAIDCDSCNNLTEEYNWVQNNEYVPSKHSEILAIRCWIVGAGNQTNNGVTIRYNFVENSNSTAMIATPCNTDIHASNWAIYGNVFLYNKAEIMPGYKCNSSGTECGNGDGWLSIWNFGTYGFGGYLYAFNNTISSIDQSGQGVSGQGGSCHHDWGGISGASMGNVAFYNNLYYNCQENIAPSSCPGTCSSYVDDYNSYFNMTETNDSSAHVQAKSSLNPFVNANYEVANNNNFSLTGASDPTSAWFNTSSLVAGNGTDLMGNARTSSRGALQFTSASDPPPPSPPTGLTAAVQ